MRKLLFFACMTLCIASCSKGNGVAKSETNGDAIEEVSSNLATDSAKDSLTIREGKHDLTATIKIVAPTGNEALTASIIKMIKETLEMKGDADATDIKALAHAFVTNKVEELKEDVFYEGEDPDGPPLNYDVVIEVLYENDEIITMSVDQDVYLGGPHGSYLVKGVTFNKADGKVLGTNILAQDKIEDVKKAVSGGLVEFFKDLMGEEYSDDESPMTDENGKQKIVDLPESGIYINNDSVVFQYQQYEVAPYAFGLPATSFSLKEMKENGWLSEEFSKTIE